MAKDHEDCYPANSCKQVNLSGYELKERGGVIGNFNIMGSPEDQSTVDVITQTRSELCQESLYSSPILWPPFTKTYKDVIISCRIGHDWQERKTYKDQTVAGLVVLLQRIPIHALSQGSPFQFNLLAADHVVASSFNAETARTRIPERQTNCTIEKSHQIEIETCWSRMFSAASNWTLMRSKIDRPSGQPEITTSKLLDSSLVFRSPHESDASSA